MNYAGYVAAAYAVFVAGMLWDWLSPWLQTRLARRAAALSARRASRVNAAAQSDAAPTFNDRGANT